MARGLTRRQWLASLGIGGLLPALALAAPTEGEAPTGLGSVLIGASWRGPQAQDTHYAGVLVADWERRSLQIRHAVALPSRAHGLLAEADGSLLVAGVRPGSWLLRLDAQGQVQQQLNLADESTHVRLNGHVAPSPDGSVLYTTETDYQSGRGRLGVRDRKTLRKLAEWDSGGLEPHQLVLDAGGSLFIANGGVPRTLADKRYDLERMDSSLVRLDGQSGRLQRQWRLDDPLLSLRHLAWSHAPSAEEGYLGVALQAQHTDAALRAQAPVLAVLDGDVLRVPTRMNDGLGYAGDIAGSYNGGFVLSSNKAGLAQIWFQGEPGRLSPIVKLKETYALASWAGPQPSGGVLAAAAAGLVRWHPSAPPVVLPWPQPMVLDNHWVLLSQRA